MSHRNCTTLQITNMQIKQEKALLLLQYMEDELRSQIIYIKNNIDKHKQNVKGMPQNVQLK